MTTSQTPNVLPVPASQEAVLQQHISQIKEHFHAGKGFYQKALESIISIGEHLCQCKELLPHGQFGSWLEENFEKDFNLSQKTAENYMNLYRDRTNILEMTKHQQIPLRQLYVTARPKRVSKTCAEDTIQSAPENISMADPVPALEEVLEAPTSSVMAEDATIIQETPPQDDIDAPSSEDDATETEPSPTLSLPTPSVSVAVAEITPICVASKKSPVEPLLTDHPDDQEDIIQVPVFRKFFPRITALRKSGESWSTFLDRLLTALEMTERSQHGTCEAA